MAERSRHGCFHLSLENLQACMGPVGPENTIIEETIQLVG